LNETYTQNNNGESVRAALGDYVEIQSLSVRVDDLLALLPAEALDWLSLRNEKFFDKRFGFSARDTARPAFIAGKNEFGLTDEELSFLRRVGSARPHRDGAVFSATYFDAAVAAISLLALLPMLATCLAAFATITSWTLGALGTLLSALALCGVLGWAAYQLYLRPRRILGEFGRRVFVGDAAASAG
jgi:hypothetical protein